MGVPPREAIQHCDKRFLTLFISLTTSLVFTTGNPSSKYEHRRALALLRNIQNIRICVGKKTYCFCNLRKWKDFNKKQLTLLKMCVTSLLCGPRADLWPFYGFLCKRFSLYIKVSTCSLCTDVPIPSEKNREKRLYGKERCVTTLKTAV